METMNQVFVCSDMQGRVMAVDSDVYLPDPTGWVQVDAGNGDRYRHAQGNYLPGPITDALGRYRYKLDGGEVAERTAAELAADAVPENPPSEEERIAALEAAVLELALGGDA